MPRFAIIHSSGRNIPFFFCFAQSTSSVLQNWNTVSTTGIVVTQEQTTRATDATTIEQTVQDTTRIEPQLSNIHFGHPLEPVPDNLIETETVHDNIIQHYVDENANEMFHLGIDTEVTVTTEENNETVTLMPPTPEPSTSFAVNKRKNKRTKQKVTSDHCYYKEKESSAEDEYVDVDDDERLAHIKKKNSVYSCKVCLFRTLDKEIIKLHKYSHSESESDSDDNDDENDEDYIPPMPKRKATKIPADVSKKAKPVPEIKIPKDDLVLRKTDKIVSKLNKTKACVKKFEEGSSVKLNMKRKQTTTKQKPLKKSARIKKQKINQLKKRAKNTRLREMIGNCNKLKEFCKNQRGKGSDNHFSCCEFYTSVVKTIKTHLKHRCDPRYKQECRLFSHYTNIICKNKLYTSASLAYAMRLHSQ